MALTCRAHHPRRHEGFRWGNYLVDYVPFVPSSIQWLFVAGPGAVTANRTTHAWNPSDQGRIGSFLALSTT